MVSLLLCDNALPWYLDKLVLPAFFVLLGTIIGFLSSQAKDYFDARRSKAAFLKAITLELAALEEQLNASLLETTESRGRMQKPGGLPPILLGTLRTTVFDTQLGRLRGLNDPILMEVVKLYSDLGILQKLLSQQNQLGNELTRTATGTQAHSQLSGAMSSILIALEIKLAGFLKRIKEVRSKLPLA